MSNPLTRRLNQILPKLTSNDFLTAHGIGNEIAFYIFDYAPEDELRVREHIRFLLDHLPKNRPGLRVAHVNLFDFLIHYLKERNLLGASSIKCCYAAAGSGTVAEETGLRAPVSERTSIRDHKGIVVAKKMS